LSGARCHWLYVISYVRAMFSALTDGATGFKTGLVRDRCGPQGSKSGRPVQWLLPSAVKHGALYGAHRSLPWVKRHGL